MKHNREFEIAWQGLKSGVHTFKYELDDKFLEGREGEREFKDLAAQVTVRFDKKVNFFMLHFDVGGAVTVPCDRCGDDFRLNLWDEFDLVIKLTDAEEAAEIDDEADVVFIPRSETVIDLSNWMYEFVMLSVPLQHIHPPREDGSSGCNPEALKLLNALAEQHSEENRSQLWKGLDKLKEEEEKTDKRKTK